VCSSPSCKADDLTTTSHSEWPHPVYLSILLDTVLIHFHCWE
jgi:hypothetical protein